MMASIRMRIRRVFGLRRYTPSTANQELFRLLDHLQSTCGGVVIGCPCGGFVTPVINRRQEGMEIAALACLQCHAVNGLDEPGFFLEDGEVSAPRPTLH